MRRSLLLMLALLAALPAAAGAQTPPPATAPVATTGAAEAIGDTGATLTGTVDRNGGATTYHFEYGTSAAYGLSTPETPTPTSGTDPVTVKRAITGLTPSTTYHFRLVATNPAGVSRGADRAFTTTGPSAPTVRSTGSRDVGTRDARLITTVDPNRQATTVRFQYGTSTRYGSWTDPVPAGSGDSGVPISVTLSGLRPHVRYHFRAVATNASGRSRSVDRSFLTLREPTAISIALTPSRVVWGGAVTVIGRVIGTGISGTPIALESQGFPFQSAFSQVGSTRTVPSDGSFRFDVPFLSTTTHFRVVTRSKVLVASTIHTASSALKVGATARSRGLRRASISGAIWPLVPAGRVSLQKRSPRGRWAVVRRAAAKRLDANRSRYAFTVKRGRKTGRYRVVVVARDGGAHVPGRSRQVRVRPLRHAG